MDEKLSPIDSCYRCYRCSPNQNIKHSLFRNFLLSSQFSSQKLICSHRMLMFKFSSKERSGASAQGHQSGSRADGEGRVCYRWHLWHMIQWYNSNISPHFVCRKYVKNRQSAVALVHIWLVSVFLRDCVSNLLGLGVFERPSKGQQNREAWWQRAKIQSRGWCWRWRWVRPWQERMELGILVAACILICGVCSK